MIVRHTGRCGQNISQTSGTNKRNRIFDPKGQHPGCIHCRRDGQICQSEERPTLTDSPAIEMIFPDEHARLRVRFIYKGQLHTICRCKTVIPIQ